VGSGGGGGVGGIGGQEVAKKLERMKATLAEIEQVIEISLWVYRQSAKSRDTKYFYHN